MLKQNDIFKVFENSSETTKNDSTKPNTDSSFFLPCRDTVRLEVRIKDRFKVLLNRIGRSQNWLADEIGISKGTMSRIANGDWFPQSEVMIRICQILEIDSSALFGDSKLWKKWNNKMVYPKEVKK